MKKIRLRNIMMMTFIVLIVSVSTNLAQAKLTVDIVVKPSFQVDERAYFNYVINSDEDIEITYYSAIICPDYLLPFLIEKISLHLSKIV